jgi:hypothetical protein
MSICVSEKGGQRRKEIQTMIRKLRRRGSGGEEKGEQRRRKDYSRVARDKGNARLSVSAMRACILKWFELCRF